jgi:hypothetical protein
MGNSMRRGLPQLIVVAAVGLAFGIVYRYFLDEPSEASVANYLRSGVHGISVALVAWGANRYFNLRASTWLRTWPLLAEIALRAFVMATAIAGVIAGLQVVIYDRPLSVTWLLDDFPKILAMSFVLSVVGSAIYELVRLIGGRVLLNVILGRYRHPTREDRVMMFLDLTGSTSLAEALGEVRMQDLLTRFFFDIDEPIVAHGGEVHAYVGDEVIVSWPFTAQFPRDGVSTAFLPSRIGLREALILIDASSARFPGFAPRCMRVRWLSANAATHAVRSPILVTR